MTSVTAFLGTCLELASAAYLPHQKLRIGQNCTFEQCAAMQLKVFLHLRTHDKITTLRTYDKITILYNIARRCVEPSLHVTGVLICI